MFLKEIDLAQVQEKICCLKAWFCFAQLLDAQTQSRIQGWYKQLVFLYDIYPWHLFLKLSLPGLDTA